MTTPPPALLTVNEVASFLRVSRSCVYRLLKRGDLPGFQVGSDWRFQTQAIVEMTERAEPIEMRIVR